MGIFLPGEEITADRMNERTIDVIGGQYRITTAGAIVSETVVATISNVALRASTQYAVELDARWGNSVDGEQFGFRIRDTNIGGTILSDSVSKGFGGGAYFERCVFPFFTTSATTRSFVATFLRVVSVSGGNGGVNPNTRFRVVREGDSGIFTTT